MKMHAGMLALSVSLILASCGTGKKLEQAQAQIASLETNVSTLNQKISTYETEIAQLKEENLAYSKEMQNCREVREAIQKNLQAINNAMAANATTLKEVYRKAAANLEMLEEAGATVVYDEGLVRISLTDKLLFKSGSVAVSKEGTDALAVVGQLLNDYPKLKTYVVGNTDDAAVKSGFKDNWSLSTERANAILRVLRDKYQVDPSRMVAAGMGKYNPIADNSTAEGKAMNRRIEIIVNPDLSHLWEVKGAQ